MIRALRFFTRFFGCLVMALLGTVAPGANASAEFEEANRLYERGDYAAAAQAYEQMIEDGQISAAVYFNLGNAYYESGRPGRAIASYHDALKLSPRDPDIRANLQFVRSRVAGGQSAPRGEWLQRLSVNEWAVVAAIVFGTFFGLLTVRQLKPEWRPALRGVTLAGGIMAAVVAVCLATAIHREYFVETAIVIAPEATARRGPFDESQPAFTAPDGKELRVLDRRNNWLQVGDRLNQIGWMRGEKLEIKN